MDSWCYILIERHESETEVHQVFRNRDAAIEAARVLTRETMQAAEDMDAIPQEGWREGGDPSADYVYWATDGDPWNRHEIAVDRYLVNPAS